MRIARKSDAFTLVELLVVIGIIAVLAGLLMPALMRARVQAQETSTLSLIHQCELAAQTFFNDYGDYPPSRWYEVDEFFEYDRDGDGVYSRRGVDRNGDGDVGDLGDDTLPDEVWFGPNDPLPNDGATYEDLTVNGNVIMRYRSGWPIPLTFDMDDNGTPDYDANEGIEIFLACLTTQNGGPYLEPSSEQLGNTDGDFDFYDGNADGTNNLYEVFNMYWGGTDQGTDPGNAALNGTIDRPLFELVDYWGNPLVYFHNRDYSAHDGVYDPGTGTLVFDDPTDSTPAIPEYVGYVDAQGTPQVGYARSRYRTTTMTHPNLNSFQLYSWGTDVMPGRAYIDPNTGQSDLIYPGWTAGTGTIPNAANGGLDLAGVSETNWVPGDGNLCNFEE